MPACMENHLIHFFFFLAVYPPPSGISKGALAGIIIGTIAGSVMLSAAVSLIIMRRHIRKYHAYAIAKRRSC